MKCPSCGFEYTYEEGDKLVCSACQFKWDKHQEVYILDANGNKLVDGDSVIVIKDLKVKGSSTPLKQGTKVDNIKIQDGDHNISCRIDGFGAMDLKSEFVKKA
ncbi:MAG TPA: alkylphosphonate utilization protein [Acholeplasma sp.]|jgi:protein PhnA|nr:zinc ribbon domain-containing protein YjdM [Acholeplasmatales bacterium]HHV33897.1 alkylphosphonate utilization protein [Acholeplasma sp.]